MNNITLPPTNILLKTILPIVAGETNLANLSYTYTDFPNSIVVDKLTGGISGIWDQKTYIANGTVTVTDSGNNNSVTVTINFFKPNV